VNLTAWKVIFVILGFALWFLVGEVDYPVVYEGGTLNSFLRPGTPVDLQIRGRYGLDFPFTSTTTIATKGRNTNIGRPGTRNDVTGLRYKPADGTVTITWYHGNMKLLCQPDAVAALERATGQKARQLD
jgi:hypothetical protein